MRLLETSPRFRPLKGVPIGIAVHATALVGLVLAALFAPTSPLEPQTTLLRIELAPPPPPPLRRGSPLEVEALGDESAGARRVETRVPSDAQELRRVPEIPSEVLSPRVDLVLGAENGFDDGSFDGMEGGVAGGVVGGVPGGLVGGLVGGTGDGLPRYPEPDVGPRPIQMPQPSYTKEAIREKVTGVVVLRAIIDEQGKVQVLKVLHSVPELDDEAIRVVESRWRFAPAVRNGRPVPVLSDLRVRFQLY